ncbi:MAG: hypothetical protein II132_09785, partial [Desulfovibrio sp.]|nr:hypothetical protein [Desulfovibrio sp.]
FDGAGDVLHGCSSMAGDAGLCIPGNAVIAREPALAKDPQRVSGSLCRLGKKSIPEQFASFRILSSLRAFATRKR